jgi:hypothetical protein
MIRFVPTAQNTWVLNDAFIAGGQSGAPTAPSTSPWAANPPRPRYRQTQPGPEDFELDGIPIAPSSKTLKPNPAAPNWPASVQATPFRRSLRCRGIPRKVTHYTRGKS